MTKVASTRKKSVKFVGKCKYHGKTEFTQKGCIRCRNNLRAIYRVYSKRTRSGEKIYYTTGNKDISNIKICRMLPYLTKIRKDIAKQFITRITKGPGTYGIFVINKRFTSGENEAQKYLGECLYVGQSINVKARVADHVKKINIARKDENRELCQFPYPKIPSMYYDIAEYPEDRIKIVKLTSISSEIVQKMNSSELYEALTYLEQWGMDCFDPRLNVTAARRSDQEY